MAARLFHALFKKRSRAFTLVELITAALIAAPAFAVVPVVAFNLRSATTRADDFAEACVRFEQFAAAINERVVGCATFFGEGYRAAFSRTGGAPFSWSSPLTANGSDLAAARVKRSGSKIIATARAGSQTTIDVDKLDETELASSSTFRSVKNWLVVATADGPRAAPIRRIQLLASGARITFDAELDVAAGSEAMTFRASKIEVSEWPPGRSTLFADDFDGSGKQPLVVDVADAIFEAREKMLVARVLISGDEASEGEPLAYGSWPEARLASLSEQIKKFKLYAFEAIFPLE